MPALSDEVPIYSNLLVLYSDDSSYKTKGCDNPNWLNETPEELCSNKNLYFQRTIRGQEFDKSRVSLDIPGKHFEALEYSSAKSSVLSSLSAPNNGLNFDEWYDQVHEIYICFASSPNALDFCGSMTLHFAMNINEHDPGTGSALNSWDYPLLFSKDSACYNTHHMYLRYLSLGVFFLCSGAISMCDTYLTCYSYRFLPYY